MGSCYNGISVTIGCENKFPQSSIKSWEIAAEAIDRKTNEGANKWIRVEGNQQPPTTSVSIKQQQSGYKQAGAAGMKYCWRSRWRGDDGQVWLDSKESCQRRWGMAWFPNTSLFTHTQAGRPTLEVSLCSRHAWVHLCLSSVSLHLLCVYSESAGGRQDTYTFCTGKTSLNKKWKLLFIAVSFRATLLAPVGEAQVTRHLKPFWLPKGPSCWPGDWRRGGLKREQTW